MFIFVLALFCCLLLSPARAADCSSEDQAEVSFDTPSLKGKKCKDLDRDYCIFGDETKKKCPCNCKKFIYPEEAEQQPSGKKPGAKGGKGGRGRRWCFHADDTVETEDGEQLSMRRLAQAPNARVLTGEKFSGVRYWLHAEPETIATFLVLTTESGHRVRISSEHLIYRSINCQRDREDAVFARRLRPGHCLRVYDAESDGFILTSVTNVTTESTKGIYAPITETGSIVVNGVLASCYTNYEDEAIQKVMYGVLLGARDFMDTWKPLRWISDLLFGDRTTATAHVPMFVYTLLDLSSYFVHA